MDSFGNKNQIEKKYYCFHCGNNGKKRLNRLTVSNKTFYTCPDCFEELGRESGCVSEFLKNYNPAISFSMSNLQMTVFCRHLKKRIEKLEEKISQKEVTQ